MMQKLSEHVREYFRNDLGSIEVDKLETGDSWVFVGVVGSGDFHESRDERA